MVKRARAPQPKMAIERSGPGERVEISFGNATLRAPRATDVERAYGIEESRRAMQSLAVALLALPGIELAPTPGLPRFYVDKRKPKLVIRDLDGVRQRGTFVEGCFVEVS